MVYGSRVLGPESWNTLGPGSTINDWEQRVKGVCAVLRDNLSELETKLAIEHAPGVLLEDPVKLRDRVRFLQEHVGGCNVTSLVLGAPGLLSCSKDDGQLESRILFNLKRLQEELIGVSAFMVISKLPRLLLKDMDTKILPKIQFLEQALPSAGEFDHTHIKFSQLIGLSFRDVTHPCAFE